MLPFRLSLSLLLCLSCLADTKLDALRETLVPMRGKPLMDAAPRGATPQLTTAKHQLRDWVEARLTELPATGGEGALEAKLNGELHAAGLLCEEGMAVPCPDGLPLGFLDQVSLRRSFGFLIVQTGVGIECGFDASAYLYRWTGGAWKRVWENEQNTYTKTQYKPQSLREILISPYGTGNDALVLTLGFEPWCSSSWHNVYYRLYRTGAGPQEPPLLEGSERAYEPNRIRGAFTENGVLIEYTSASIDANVHNREAVHHYRIENGTVRRIAPLALKPRDFVEEWLTHPWQEASSWSEPLHRLQMSAWHRKQNNENTRRYYTASPTMHCAARPDLWQVQFSSSASPTAANAEWKDTWFLVRWRPPYTFSMVEVRNQPSPGCTEEDREIDGAFRTLFPGQPRD